MDARVLCLKRLKKLDHQLELLHQKMINYPQEAINFVDQEDMWAPIQICMHLQLSESLSLKNAVYNIGRADSRPKVKLKSTINSIMLTLVLYSPFKFKSPPLTRFDSGFESLEIEKVFQDWFQIRRDIQVCIQKCPLGAFDKQIYKHPYAGYLSLKQMIFFFRNHFIHHRKQIYQRIERWEKSNRD